MVNCLWNDLWGSYPSSPMLNVYHDWDELGPMEIDEVVDEFIEDYFKVYENKEVKNYCDQKFMFNVKNIIEINI